MVTYEVRARCDCGGQFFPLSNVSIEWPNPHTRHPHKCNLCGAREMFPKVYPRLETKHKPKGP